MDTDENRNRALWAHALRDLAETIARGSAPVPTGLDIWTQYVTPFELLHIADFTTPEPLAVSLKKTTATVRVPTGRPLNLPIEWLFQTEITADDEFRGLIKQHNEKCLNPAAGE